MIGKILNFIGLKFIDHIGRVAIFMAVWGGAGNFMVSPLWAQTVPPAAEPQRLDKRFEQFDL